jgi:hypothetical protein
MKTTLCVAGLWISVTLMVGGCVSLGERVLDSGTQTLQLRSIQSRVLETGDRERTLRTVIATLQDLGFLIEKADATLGAVSGSKLAQTDLWGLRMTVTVSPGGPGRLLVRANAQLGQSAVTEAEPYQRFFAALERAMFLTAHQVD